MQLKMSRDDLTKFLHEQFLQVADEFEVADVAPMQITMRKRVGDKHLRPGGTVSGPTMFALADVSMYLAILAMIGPKALAVTTNCAIDFMRKPRPDADLIAHCKLHKLGRVLAVGDVLIHSEGDDAPVARASLTYSIPPEKA
ncbi:PaaI family thioesterase [Aliiroseovarius sp. KMU-50]|uniref:PaaI family thioesterase n=1 Tax=Aliiroseovarius salicola TaxID=3009082 RepID=A0ABT4W6U3_9RHOB|nr:PaaI family thioesterase [Aliiroseovarius sp. KMU-50]MDA5095687.1 PaaI family thioesterase [Aliiroseovarius sp. KMU-50]